MRPQALLDPTSNNSNLKKCHHLTICRQTGTDRLPPLSRTQHSAFASCKIIHQGQSKAIILLLGALRVTETPDTQQDLLRKDFLRSLLRWLVIGVVAA